ncbi:MAG: transglutaminase family protein [Bryobacterales bacterium]|nr:transglutaminase family protein [Bryobacterales bacterium]
MRFEISHFTEYHYSEPVKLGAHYLRLRPREDGTQRLVDFRLHLEPRPAGMSLQTEPDGNVALVARFADPARLLRIHTQCIVETHRANPFDFVITERGASTLPMRYSPSHQAVLGPALDGVAGPRVRQLAEDVAREVNFDTLRFLSELNNRVYRTMRVVLRMTGQPMDPESCLELGEGACRDLALVFMAACRHMGVASRFVSGYQMTDPNGAERHMHAWAEVFLPGGGWRGFDPTHGIAIDEHFVPVAASPDPLLATPIEGGYVPASAESTMHVVLDVLSSCAFPAVPATLSQ